MRTNDKKAEKQSIHSLKDVGQERGGRYKEVELVNAGFRASEALFSGLTSLSAFGTRNRRLEKDSPTPSGT